MKFWIYLVTFLVLISIVSGTQIHGSVYGSSLNKVQNVVVEIDSNPTQKMLAKNGEYAFEINPGQYTLSAFVNNTLIAKEEVVVKEEGNFIIDLFAFPDFSEEDAILTESDEPALEESLFSTTSNSNFLILILILLLIGGFVAWKKFFKRKPEIKQEKIESTDPSRIIEILKKEGGRMNQKELRKYFPLSEAKISLMVTELEVKGKIEKIKKGRGNILILKE